MPLEAERLTEWLSTVEVVDYTGSLFPTEALSRSDQSSLAWSVENHAQWLLADERLLRRFAQERGIQVIGFCGILLQAVSRGEITAREARALIDSAIREHDFRISVELYQHIVGRLGSI
jgi:predicted nucleic acid-binding protein